MANEGTTTTVAVAHYQSSTTSPYVQQQQQQQEQFSDKRKFIAQHRIICFCATYIAYASIHATRTAWSASKQSLKQDLDEDNSQFLGIVDTCFLLSYAISMKFIGTLSRKLSINYLLGFGMISASVCLLSIYFICQTRINKSFILFMMIVNGISQSTGWPSVVACMGNWFGTGQKGLLMGLWATNSNFGNMIGYFIQDFIVNTLDLNWTFVLFLVGMLLLTIGSLIVFNLKAYPQKLGISVSDLEAFDKIQQESTTSTASPIKSHHSSKQFHIELQEEQVDPESLQDHQQQQTPIDEENEQQQSQEQQQQQEPKQISDEEVSTKDSASTINNSLNQLPQTAAAAAAGASTTSLSSETQENSITYFNAWTRIPGLAVFALTMGGVKGTVYGMMFWMPIYLQENGLKQEAAWICSMNEIGTFAGGLLLGHLIDRLPKFRATLITCFLALSSIIMLTIHLLPFGAAVPYFFAVLFAGVCLGGPYTLLGGAIAIDLAQQPEVKGMKNITALLAGMIEGFGSFVAAIVQIVIPMCGQQNIFLLFVFSTLFSSLFLVQKAAQEVRTQLFN